MNILKLRGVFVFTLVILVAALTVPAHAMGRSGAPTRTTAAPAQVAETLSRMESEHKELQASLQSQIETLRKELEDLRAAISLRKGAALAQ